VTDMPAWLRITSLAFAVLLIPGLIAHYHITEWIKRKWHNRVRWFR
jgi:hypothetical protein